MVLTPRGILSTSVLCIVGVITLPILGNLISNDLYNILQSWLSLRMRLLIVTVMIILCVFTLIMEIIYHKDRRLFVRLSKDVRLLLPLFKDFKGRSYLPVREPPDSQITQCTRSGFKIAYDPLRYDPDVLIARNILDSCREEGQVPDVEAGLQSEYTTKSSTNLILPTSIFYEGYDPAWVSSRNKGPPVETKRKPRAPEWQNQSISYEGYEPVWVLGRNKGPPVETNPKPPAPKPEDKKVKHRPNRKVKPEDALKEAKKVVRRSEMWPKKVEGKKDEKKGDDKKK